MTRSIYLSDVDITKLNFKEAGNISMFFHHVYKREQLV